MTINASTGCGAGMPLGATESSNAGGTGADITEAAAGSSAFSSTLSGMTDKPGTADTQAPLPEDPEDTTLLEPVSSPADAAAAAAAAALVSAFMPAIAPSTIITQLKQATLPATELLSAAAGKAGLAAVPADSTVLDADWLAQAKGVASGEPTRLQSIGVIETLEDLAASGVESASTAVAGKSPGPGFSPMTLVSQLGNAIAQTLAPAVHPQTSLQHSVGSARWAEELGSRLTMMASQGQLSGSLTLSPEHLGPLQVQIDIKNDVANVWFGSQHADTRAALQDALPRLREMFVASGLVLGDTGVSRDTPRQDAQATGLRRFNAQREEAVPGGIERRGIRIAHTGIIDTYA